MNYVKILFDEKEFDMSTTEKASCAIGEKHCLPCEGGIPALDGKAIQQFMKQLTIQWNVRADEKAISYDFRFKNYYQTMAFVNAIAWMSHLENHHADIEVSYNHCVVHYSTHAIDGLSENDFICAAKVNQLFQPYAEKFHDRK
jgi:4a-hydroxytetrahydrobiopterin dehydratase